MKTFMLDTNICSFIMREHPVAVIAHLEAAVKSRSRVVISAITYAEMRYGATSPKAPKRVESLVSAFVQRLDAVLPWDAEAIEECVKIRQALFKKGTPIGENDAAIAGHAIAAHCILVTNNTREFSRVAGLQRVDWRDGQ
jgi:tRNA(fMet)-specific endonuclease VapC